ncbi:MAG: maleylacetoacetate isomerase [Pseudomonadota bacterium]
MRLKLYSNYINSAGERVRIALALKGMDYEYVSVNSIGWDVYEKINPQRLMPALDIGGQIVPQATAILEYLEETHPDPALLPADPVLRARVRGFSQHVVSEMHAIDVIRVRRFLHGELGLDAEQVGKWQLHWFHKGFTALEALLTSREQAWPFCFGDSPAWADLHLVPQVHKGISRFQIDMADYPLIGGIYERCYPMDAFAGARPEAMPDYPGELVQPDMAASSSNQSGL